MTERQVLEAVRDKWANDADIEAWSQAAFSKSVTVLLGSDPQDPPKEADYPILEIVGISFRRATAGRTKTWILEVACGVVYDEIVESGNTKTYSGLLLAAELRELAEAAIGKKAGLGRVSVDTESFSADFFPMFVELVAFEIEQINTSRG